MVAQLRRNTPSLSAAFARHRGYVTAFQCYHMEGRQMLSMRFSSSFAFILSFGVIPERPYRRQRAATHAAIQWNLRRCCTLAYQHRL